MGGGGEGAKGNTWRRNADTKFFLHSSVFSRSLRGGRSGPDYIWHGWVHERSHDTGLSEREREGKSREEEEEEEECLRV